MKPVTNAPSNALVNADHAAVEELDEAALASVTGGGPLLDFPESDVDSQQKLFDFVNRR